MMRDKWNIRKSYFKIDVAVDMKKKKILPSRKLQAKKWTLGRMLKKLVDNI